MKKFLLRRLPPWFTVFFIIGCVSWSSQQVWRPLIPAAEVSNLNQSLPEKIVSATVALHTPDGLFGGSGVLVRRDDGEWYCWTAAHVVESLKKECGLSRSIVLARIFDQRQGLDMRVESRIQRVIAIDEKLDLALLQIILPDFPFTSAVVDRAPIELGREVINCGFPHVGVAPWNTVWGRISQVPGEEWNDPPNYPDGKYLGCSLMAFPGCSGSGIWDASTGRLLGILVAAFGPGGITFIHNDVMAEFAKEHDITWALGKNLFQ